MIWFTADCHLGHANVVKYSARPFKTVKAMDDCLINNWNSYVRPKDTIYVLGDLTLSRWDLAQEYLTRLRGRIRIVPGNHDVRGWLRQKPAAKLASAFHGRVLLMPPIVKVKWEKQILILCHYAMRTWDRSHYGTWHLHGHSHGALGPLGKSFDVGTDCNNYFPWSFDDVRTRMAGLPDPPLVKKSKLTQK